MSEPAADFHPGDQDVKPHLASYLLFNSLMHWAALSIAAILVSLVLWFCVGSGFFAGLIVGLIIQGVGSYVLTRPTRAH
jgi:Na+/H+-translocating membrane pyrophosphatase